MEVQRRLAAILAADVVGYSRLMGANEVGTLAALKSHRSELIDPKIAEHYGRIVKLTGDGMLVEFPSVVHAVDCAAKVQIGMRDRNLDMPVDRRIELRIGVHLGDIILEEDDIFGDGVNIAARIEGVAKSGGVAVSASVRENVGNKLDLIFEDGGEQLLKNIEQPVRVYNVVLPAPEVKAVSAAEQEKAETPSIAVLPFNNMSNDPEQEYFSDGITEDIITDLSKVSGLFVIGRNTSFTYKGKAVQLQEVATELGVKYLLEGSVRKSGQRVRVTGQLIDGATGGHVWADRFDRDLTDIFAIQDEITHSIVEQLRVRLLPEEQAALKQAPTISVEAYNYYLRGRQLFHAQTKTSLIMARQMFARAKQLDPAYALAYAGMANCDSYLNTWHGISIPAEETLALADKALTLSPDLAEAHAARGVALVNANRRDEAGDAFRRALALNPDSHEANVFYARYLMINGDFAGSVPYWRRGLEIRQDDFSSPIFFHSALRQVGRFEESVAYGNMGLRRAEEALRQFPESSRPAQLGACLLAEIGETDKARAWLEIVLAIDPDDANARYNAACVFAILGDADRAVEIMEKLLPVLGPEVRLNFTTDPDFAAIRDHPRHPALMVIAEGR